MQAATAIRASAGRAHPTMTAAPWAAPLVWVVVVIGGYVLGARLHDRDPLVHIGAPPLVGSYDVQLSWRLVGAVALGTLAVAYGPRIASRLRWCSLLVASWATGAGWAVALGATNGWDAISAPLRTRYEYLTAVPAVESPGRFLSTFTDALPTYATHVKGHPPGMVLLLWGMDRVGLGGAGAAAALVIAAGAVTAPAALIALRALAGEHSARAAAPFLVFAPAAVWVATSGDALFAGVAGTGVALFALACTARDRAAVPALAAGVVLGAGLFLSYGVAPLAAVVLAIALGTRRPAPLGWAALGAGAVGAGFLLAGFEWFDGLATTRELYAGGVASRRPYGDFLVIDLAAFALAVGPAALAGVARLRTQERCQAPFVRRGAWPLVAGAVVAVLAADVSGMSRGETERIWLPFAPWLLVATAALRGSRRWLAAQVALGIVLQTGVRSPW